nr:immunoglobulin heavy chain junction region [Macaca mulatta]MOW89233.1 immunoglobulin heavy chain junction region [Macaca mulatta]MOW89305.1 immunoglobulin heavy chain junction region [Macaca mulatta]MOW89472.1 immunoglobulin heavy chain junction region [Macaca mulatta]MOW91385.1 immunoglobulin heavy chain junction region [Macaca mulatta]
CARSGNSLFDDW